MKFTNLHTHTTYSFLDGFGTAKQTIDRLTKINQDCLAVTDHGNIFAHIPFHQEFKKADKHLVYGCEFYIVEKIINERGYYHITILAKNNQGYSNLLKMANVAEKQKYYKPRITFDQLIENSKGLIILSGCIVDGYLHTGNSDWWLKKFKKTEWYIELQPFKDEKIKWDKLVNLSNKHGLPAVVTFDCHYPEPENKNTHDFMLAINTNKPLSDPDRLKMEYPLHLPSIEEVMQRCKEMGKYKEEWITDTYKISQKCNVELPKTSLIKIKADINDIKKQCYNRLKQLKINNEKYKQRLDYELKLIEEKKFTDYFAIILNLMSFAKKDILCSPGRGSSAGSLVCYLLRITEIDPIKYNLLFERFIDLNRADLPDIDLDFQASKREDIIAYLENKYSKENTAQIITFNTFKPRAILQDAARILNIPQWEIKKAANQIVERLSGDYRADYCLADSIDQFSEMKALFIKYPKLHEAVNLEGQLRQFGKNAAGVVISSIPVEKIGQVINNTIGIDKRYIDSYGMLKIDILGLETLDIIRDVCEQVKFNWRKLYSIPLDDKKVYDRVFKRNKLIGIFQFEGVSVSNICKQIQPDNFNQLIHITSLGRPGAMGSGGMIEYIERFKGKKYDIDEAIKPYVNDTFGVVIFQEQVMSVVKYIGNFSWEDTSTIRQAMSKSKGAEFFDKFREKFIKGAAENKLPRNRSIDIWNQCYHMGQWAFNLSHATSYALVSYWTAYIKTYFPDEFYARILKNEIDEAKISKTLKEYGKQIIPFDLNKSKIYFSFQRGKLVGGLTNIKGIGEKAAGKVISGQPYESIEDFKSRIPKGIAAKIEEVIKNGISWTNIKPMQEQVKDKLEISKLSYPLIPLSQLNGGERFTLGKVVNINLKDHNEDAKVQKRGYKIEGVSEYVSLRVIDDDFNFFYIVYDKYFTAKNKQQLLNLKNKICLFRVVKLDGGLILGKGVKELS